MNNNRLLVLGALVSILGVGLFFYFFASPQRRSPSETGMNGMTGPGDKLQAQEKTPEEVCLEHNCSMKNCGMKIKVGLIPGERIICPVCGEFITGENSKLIEEGQGKTPSKKERKVLYYRNPMDPRMTSPVPIKDSMGMDYVPVYKEEGVRTVVKEKKILYYRNPMNPQVTSPVPMKDQMGMDYVPVYGEAAGAETAEGVSISPEKQELLGIKVSPVEKKDMVKTIRAFGKIAYDPELVVTQEEFIQALKVLDGTKDSPQGDVADRAGSMAEAARQKLKLLGMSDEEVAELGKTRRAQTNLYLPAKGEDVWAYLSIYEFEVGFIKAGLSVKIEAVAFPGETFEGEIVSVNPTLDPISRTNQVRAEVKNPGGKLKPEMFVSATVDVALGKMLAVPREAVMDTGKRKVVFVLNPEGYFVSREVKTGAEAGDHYEVISGLGEGEKVVSSGNFFVDSESRLKSVVGGESVQQGK